MGRRIWVNVIALLENGEEHTAWNGLVEAKEIMVVIAPGEAESSVVP